tara:strand:+ start:2915 stop:3745 length:831 start_codon:yes stop_codon:yes gene_type:complete
MLGFSTLSESPLSQSTTAVNANSFLPGVLAQFNAGTLDYEAKAFSTIPSVSATGSVDIEVDAQGFVFISDVDVTTGINSVSSFGKASTIPTAVSASFTASLTLADIDAKANRLIPSVSITSNSGTIGFDAQASSVLSGVVLALNNYNFTDEDAQASTTLPSVTASFSINTFTDVDAKATTLFDTTSATTTSGSLGFNAKAITPVTGVSLTLNNFDFTDEDAQAKLTLSSISATLSANLEDPTFVVFPYTDYADQYNTQRTLFIDKQDTNNTVYITA